MGEEQFYAGDRTLTAAKLRDIWLTRRLTTTSPGRWLSTVFGVLLGGKVPLPAQRKETTEFARGMLAGLGFDPDTHTLGRRRGQFPGLVVRDEADQPQMFISERVIRQLMTDPLFLNGYAEEVRT